jgi:hypothetical protein
MDKPLKSADTGLRTIIVSALVLATITLSIAV